MQTEKTIQGAAEALAAARAADLLAVAIRKAVTASTPDGYEGSLDRYEEGSPLVRTLFNVLGQAAQNHLATLADPSKITRSMLDAVRHAVETGDALRPAAWGPGFYLIVSPRAIDGSVNASIARLRNPITQAPADLDLEDMLGPWVTLPIKDAQIEAATRAADGEEVR